ncbi:DNA/RNA non-specific endonuclease [Pseudophaeobacter leonis]|uniref:DNA/RNA non-specific endonuclease n=1 Tax=Pseudophaeobacter leonis TaxID=1144477 RepID=UPI0013748026|nr:DNA/RNA non-specific endonuclease [Pseudophaeobacter leonis]
MRGDGKTAETHATLRKYHVNAERSADELKAQKDVGGKGHDTDDAGHMVGHRFGLDNGVDNLFPQDANFNRGAYKTMENEFAAWIDAGCEVRMSVTLSSYKGDRPQKVEVSYVVEHKETGKVVHSVNERFANDGKQTFERLDRTQIDQHIADETSGTK